ncbi:cyclohexanone monooxygenase [Trichodelitschia bisporula]|uniref:Cyclohexanone monooxygenase n=1 Tax=Trichodelitschia bisporula TaxID=703511 RepID=A0A6G1I192_9PEZI|nr:cyclohexanone monooxygenase [Trichodelitschia bisporula]
MLHSEIGAESNGIPEVDVLIVGAGFGGFLLMNKLRKQGMTTKIYEKGTASGGVWYWNCYPGARVDTDMQMYQILDKELRQNFTFKERYPGREEFHRYFEYHVGEAVFDESRHVWRVECADGSRIYCRWFIPCVGFAAKRFTPPFKGLSEFRGDVHHTAVWPQYSVSLKKKRTAVVGTGASGVQPIQEIGPIVEHLTVYQRTPNYALPMNQSLLNPKEVEAKKISGEWDAFMKGAFSTFVGFSFSLSDASTFDHTPEEKEKFFHKLLAEEGGFRFWLVRKRIPDPKKQELLAPEKPPHPIGTKRPALEQNFYQVVSAKNVGIIDVNKDPIIEVTERGIRTKSGFVEVNMIILATGFDSLTGSLSCLNIRGTDGGTIADHWKDGVRTAFGNAIAGFPNLFVPYAPQGPTAFANGPTCLEVQATWVDTVIRDLRAKGITRIDPKPEAEVEWTRRVNEKWNMSLFPMVKSWYQSSNIPGKRIQALNWSGGLPAYKEALDESVANDYQAWKLAKVAV